eukprot:TRINITY_DN6714_c0_g1_i1.p1 TRINITY_DN6714_c0_g1~~TRINITY_DN6714_c0_g1_i1.p1  ORF type:complete len:157 (+),score=5.60 TRINITY_DN6714_c0_g1_i1:112-582(+)
MYHRILQIMIPGVFYNTYGTTPPHPSTYHTHDNKPQVQDTTKKWEYVPSTTFQKTGITSTQTCVKETRSTHKKIVFVYNSPDGSAGVKKRAKRKPKRRPGLRCKHCDTKESPEWRKGPLGRNTLCNACGLYYARILRESENREKGSLSFILNASHT